MPKERSPGQSTTRQVAAPFVVTVRPRESCPYVVSHGHRALAAPLYIHSVDFDPVRGSEAKERRPAVIVSNDAANTTARRLGRGTVTVVPVTSNVDRVFPFQV